MKKRWLIDWLRIDNISAIYRRRKSVDKYKNQAFIIVLLYFILPFCDKIKKIKQDIKITQNQFIFYIYSKIDNKNWLVTNSERYDTSTTTANIWTQTLILRFHVKRFYPLKCYVNNSFSDWWLVNNCFTDYIHFYICQLCKNTRTVLEMLYLIQISSLLHYFIRIVELVSYISVTLSVVRSISFYRWEKMIYTWVRAHRSIWHFLPTFGQN